jgi:hypothetical protein
LEAKLNLDPDSNPDPESDPESDPELDPELITDPDHNLQIISDPAGSGSGCTTPGFTHVKGGGGKLCTTGNSGLENIFFKLIQFIHFDWEKVSKNTLGKTFSFILIKLFLVEIGFCSKKN